MIFCSIERAYVMLWLLCLLPADNSNCTSRPSATAVRIGPSTVINHDTPKQRYMFYHSTIFFSQVGYDRSSKLQPMLRRISTQTRSSLLST